MQNNQEALLGITEFSPVSAVVIPRCRSLMRATLSAFSFGIPIDALSRNHLHELEFSLSTKLHARIIDFLFPSTPTPSNNVRECLFFIKVPSKPKTRIQYSKVDLEHDGDMKTRCSRKSSSYLIAIWELGSPSLNR